MLATVGRGAHVLVHEATFDDDRAEDARRKRHSTVGEALRVARDMQVKDLVLLTHFSQRYPRGQAPPTASFALGENPVEKREDALSTATDQAQPRDMPRHDPLVVRAHDHLEVRHLFSLHGDYRAHIEGSLKVVDEYLTESFDERDIAE
jgi:ribonuclease Z